MYCADNTMVFLSFPGGFRMDVRFYEVPSIILLFAIAYSTCCCYAINLCLYYLQFSCLLYEHNFGGTDEQNNHFFFKIYSAISLLLTLMSFRTSFFFVFYLHRIVTSISRTLLSLHFTIQHHSSILNLLSNNRSSSGIHSNLANT